MGLSSIVLHQCPPSISKRIPTSIPGRIAKTRFPGYNQPRMSDHIASIYEVFEHQKTDLLIALLQSQPALSSNLVLVRSKDTLHSLTSTLNQKNLVTNSLHGNKKPELRQRTFKDFVEGKFPVLVSTEAILRDMPHPEDCPLIYFEPPERDKDFLEHLNNQRSVVVILTQHESAQSTRLEKLSGSLPRLHLDDFAYDSQPKHQKTARTGNKTNSKPLQHKKPKLKNKGPRRKTGRTRKR